MTDRTAEVIGGGIAGLAVSAALSLHGWKVRVHERSVDLREIGAGIYLKENSLRVLDHIGAFDSIASEGVRLRTAELRDSGDKILMHREYPESVRVYTTTRSLLLNALVSAAERAGVHIRTGSHVTSVAPNGEILLHSGETVAADLVVAADGVHSMARSSLGISSKIKLSGAGATRMLIDREPGDPVSQSTEYWNGRIRVLIVPCHEDHTYFGALAPETDAPACELPLNRAYWGRAFPQLEGFVARTEGADATHFPHWDVRCRTWVAGRVGLLGDAVNAQSPNFGQGAGLAISNGWELARQLESIEDIGKALSSWEAQCRPWSEKIQKWSYRYDIVAHRWPRPIQGMRPSIMSAVGSSRITAAKWAELYRGISPRSL